jgi:predicted AAA+ superfamily ATPase
VTGVGATPLGRVLPRRVAVRQEHPGPGAGQGSSAEWRNLDSAVTRQGRVVGVEIKASSTVRSEDFRGLRHLADRLGADFVAGLVLYTGAQTLPFGPNLRTVPASALWQIA